MPDMTRLLALSLVLIWSSSAFTLLADDTASSTEPVLLTYKFREGEVFRTKVTHLATVDTKVKGVQQVVKTRTTSGKSWHIKKVDAEGNITFLHQVDWVDLWNSITDRPEITLDTRKDETAPAGYEHVLESVKQPLAAITINRHGQVIARKDARPQFNPGIGDLTVPLPDKPVKPGDKWHVTEEVRVSDEQKRVKVVQVKHQYTLEKIETGVATIRVATGLITPIDDPKFEAQLVQRMQKGTIRFDAVEGRIHSRQMDLDETVLGFSGPESSMQYVARYSEEQVADDVAQKSVDGRR
jgi:hypothetical protein